MHRPNDVPAETLSGALLVDKPEGITSFGVVRELKRFLPRGAKIGHGGTLDPFATGLLIVLVGRATRLAQNFLGSDKAYEGVFRFGIKTNTADCTGETIETTTSLPSDLKCLQEAAQAFSQIEYAQIPPMFSAKKHKGKPLYKLARAGIEIEREPKPCKIWNFEILEYQAPLAKFRLHCSSGTYVRTLAEDFAKAVGSLGTLDSLRRTACGDGHWTIEQTQPLSLIGSPLQNSSAWVPYYLLINKGAMRGPSAVAHSNITV